MGDFRKKCRQADCHIKVKEPYTPWSNAAEGTIRELKRGTGRKMAKSKAPKRLWDDCLELEALVRSNTAHDIFELKGEVPETIVSGETSDISQFCEFYWYQWVKFRDTSVSFPGDKEVLGRYLGPSIDIGPAMTAKIMKSNGQYAHRTTLRALTPDEEASSDEIKARDAFDEAIHKALGPGSKPEDYDDDPDIQTPTFDPYEDDDEQGDRSIPDRDEVTGDTFDQYLGAEVTLP
jgi:hypothetical protein